VLNYNGTLDDTASLEDFSAYTVCTDGEDYAGDAEACDACTTTEAASSGVTDSTPCPDLIEAAKTVVDICGDTCVPPECSDLYTAWTVCIIQLSEACDAYGTIGGDEANGGSNNNPGGSGASDNGGGSSNACRSMASVAVVAATAAAVPLLTML
jgi:hypothetical protein